jgi:hypothetical protein
MLQNEPKNGQNGQGMKEIRHFTYVTSPSSHFSNVTHLHHIWAPMGRLITMGTPPNDLELCIYTHELMPRPMAWKFIKKSEKDQHFASNFSWGEK